MTLTERDVLAAIQGGKARAMRWMDEHRVSFYGDRMRDKFRELWDELGEEGQAELRRRDPARVKEIERMLGIGGSNE